MSDKKIKIWKGKAIFKDNSFKPMEKVDFKEGEEVNIIVVPSFFEFEGILSEVKESSVELQHKVKDFLGIDAD